MLVRGIHASGSTNFDRDCVKTDNIDINISDQPTGIYLLRITINNNSTTWKIIKK